MKKVLLILGFGVFGLSVAACSSNSESTTTSTTGAGGGTTATTGAGGSGATTGAGGSGATTGAGGSGATTGAGGSGGGAAAPCHDACAGTAAPDPVCLDCFNTANGQGGPCFDANEACVNDDGGGMAGCATCGQLLQGSQDPPCPGSADLAQAELGCVCSADACGP